MHAISIESISLDQVWIITTSLLVIVEIGAGYSVFHALRYVRTSQAAVAWTVGLIAVPVVALPMYWIVARHRFEGYREAMREVGSRHQRSVHTVQRELRTEPDARNTRQQSALETLVDVLDTPISRVDHCELLIDGRHFFQSVFKAIAAAREYVYIEFFIFRDDEIGNQLADALIDRVGEGVQVRILYDEVGCLRLSNAYVSRLTNAGIDIRPFNTRQGLVNRFQINFRNHRKLVVVDGETAIVGGLNVGDEYLSKTPDPGRWRDTGVLLTGPVTRKIQAVFAGDYYWAARENLPEANWPEPPELPADGDSGSTANAAICATGPADARPRATMMFVAAAAASKERLWICSPYLVPDEASTVALQMAKARGVDVRLLIPNQADHIGVYLAGFHYEQEFAESDIPVYRYTGGFMHQKCLLVDSELALIGSTNLDNRSLHLNFELMIAISDAKLVKEVATMLEQDFEEAIHSNNPNVPQRWWYERAGTAVARLFSPIL